LEDIADQETLWFFASSNTGLNRFHDASTPCKGEWPFALTGICIFSKSNWYKELEWESRKLAGHSSSNYFASILWRVQFMVRSTERLLNDARVMINNALTDPFIQNCLMEYGYTSDRIQAGKVLYEIALTALQKQQAIYGEQISATAALNQDWDKAKASYMRLVKITRVAFKGDVGTATRLGITGKRKDSLAGWLLQAQQFYTNALISPDLLTTLAKYGVTSAKLEAAQAEMYAVEVANQRQEKEKGEAQDATQARKAAIASLNKWLSDFVAIARIALEERPQLLESLGILKPS
jgi:hypothetical protein